MADKSHIQWTDATWNPVTGCSKVSEGCRNCYALHDWTRLSAPREKPNVYTGRKFTDIMVHPERLDQPLRWKKPRMIFVNSMSDLFHESVPDEFIAQVFQIMAQCIGKHIFQILTKRPERMMKFINACGKSETGYITHNRQNPKGFDPGTGIIVSYPEYEHLHGYTKFCNVISENWPLPNVWLGASVEDQKTADERIPLLLQTPAAVLWISAEPLLGPLDISRWLPDAADLSEYMPSGNYEKYQRLNWVVTGGESGQHARPSHPDWFRILRDLCYHVDVPFFFKQWGEWKQAEFTDDWIREYDHGEVHHWLGKGMLYPEDKSQPPMVRIGKKAAGRLLDGKEHSEYPA